MTRYRLSQPWDATFVGLREAWEVVAVESLVCWAQSEIHFLTNGKQIQSWGEGSVDQDACHATVGTCLNFQNLCISWTSVISALLWVDEKQGQGKPQTLDA